MDIKKTIEEIVTKIQKDPKLLASFQQDPEKAIESLVGIDIPDGSLDQVTSGIKKVIAAKQVAGTASQVAGAASQVAGALDSLKKVF